MLTSILLCFLTNLRKKNMLGQFKSLWKIEKKKEEEEEEAKIR